MINRLLICIVCLSQLALTSACVSVNVGPKPPTKSEGVQYTPPPTPFAELGSTRADHAWQDKRTGASLSYLSTCNESAENSLDSVTAEMVGELSNSKTLSSESIQFDGRGALLSEAEGLAEGVPTRVRVLVFRKNGCLYTLSLVALSKTFEHDRAAFDAFAQGFRAP